VVSHPDDRGLMSKKRRDAKKISKLLVGGGLWGGVQKKTGERGHTVAGGARMRWIFRLGAVLGDEFRVKQGPHRLMGTLKSSCGRLDLFLTKKLAFRTPCQKGGPV